MVSSYRANYRLKLGDHFRDVGALVPEAHTWQIVESYVRGQRLAVVEIQEQELRDAVALYCPELAERVYRDAGISAGVSLVKAGVVPAPAPAPARPPTKRTRARRGKPVAVRKPVTKVAARAAKA